MADNFNQHVRKVTIKSSTGDHVIMDISGTTATPRDVAKDKIFFTRRGEEARGLGDNAPESESYRLGDLTVFANGTHFVGDYDSTLYGWEKVTVDISGLPEFETSDPAYAAGPYDIRDGKEAYTLYNGFVRGKVQNYPGTLPSDKLSYPATKKDLEDESIIKVNLGQPNGEVFVTENKFTNNNICVVPNLKTINAEDIVLSSDHPTVLDINDKKTINAGEQRVYEGYSGFDKITIPKVEATQGIHTCDNHIESKVIYPESGKFFSSVLVNPATREAFEFNPQTKEELLAGVNKESPKESSFFDTATVKTVPSDKRLKLIITPTQRGQIETTYTPNINFEALENNKTEATYTTLMNDQIVAPDGWFFDEVVVKEIPSDFSRLRPEEETFVFKTNGVRENVSSYQYAVAEVPTGHRGDEIEATPDNEAHIYPPEWGVDAEGNEELVYKVVKMLPVPLYSEETPRNNYLYISDNKKGENNAKQITPTQNYETFDVTEHTHVGITIDRLVGTKDPINGLYAQGPQILKGYSAWSNGGFYPGEIETYSGIKKDLDNDKKEGVITNISFSDPKGTILSTNAKYCQGDIVISPNLRTSESGVFEYPFNKTPTEEGEKWTKINSYTWTIEEVNQEDLNTGKDEHAGFGSVTITLPEQYQVVQGILPITEFPTTEDKTIDVAQYQRVKIEIPASKPTTVTTSSEMTALLSGEGVIGGIYQYVGTTDEINGYENGTIYILEEIE